MPGQLVILCLSGCLSQQSPLPTLFSVSCWLMTASRASVQAGLSMVPSSASCPLLCRQACLWSFPLHHVLFCSCSVFFQAYPLLLSMTLSLINLPSDSWTLAAGAAHKAMPMVTPTFQGGRSSNTDALMHGVKSSPCFHRSPVLPLGFHVGTTIN